MNIKLSICIPTYNRSDFIGCALDSILAQATEEVDIAICDNGSTDETEKIVHEYLKKFPRITYFKFLKNQGPDRSFLKAVEIAQGQFCWLLSDDDRIEAGGIEEVLSKIKKYPHLSGMTVQRKAYDHLLKQSFHERPLVALSQDTLFVSSESCFKQLFHYLGYMSAQICRRSLWLDVAKNDPDLEKFFNAYVFSYVVGKVICKTPTWLYVHKQCIGWRSDNDSFLKELGAFRRFRLDVIGYEAIARNLVTQPSLYAQLLNKVGAVHLKSHILSMKLNSKEPWLACKILSLCFFRYWKTSVFWTALFPLALLPKSLVKLAKVMYRRFKN